MGADAQGSEVALDLEHRQVFLGADDHWSDQVMAIPRSMIAFLADQTTPNLEEELLEFPVVDGTEGGHSLGGNGNFDGFAFLADDPGWVPVLLDFLPPVLFQNLFPGSLLADLLYKELEGLGKRVLGVLEGVAVGREVKGWRVTDEHLALLEVDDGNIGLDGRSLQHELVTSDSIARCFRQMGQQSSLPLTCLS